MQMLHKCNDYFYLTMTYLRHQIVVIYKTAGGSLNQKLY